MKRISTIAAAQPEPIGIIISRGERSQDVPRFWAYVWGPAPETAPELAPDLAPAVGPRAA